MSIEERGSAKVSLFEPENEGPLPPPSELIKRNEEEKSLSRKDNSASI